MVIWELSIGHGLGTVHGVFGLVTVLVEGHVGLGDIVADTLTTGLGVFEVVVGQVGLQRQGRVALGQD